MSEKTVCVAVVDGSEDIETVATCDVLRRAGVKVVLAAVGDKKEVALARGCNIIADALLSDVKSQKFDAIACPGGLPGAHNLAKSETLIEMLKAQQQAGKLYAAICASPAVVFQPNGLLEGKRATCHPTFMKDIPAEQTSEDRVVVDGNLITSRGPGTTIEFGLAIVEYLLGPDKAAEVGNPMLPKL